MLQGPTRRRRPDGGRHGHQEVVAERVPVAPVVEELAEVVRGSSRASRISRAIPVEPQRCRGTCAGTTGGRRAPAGRRSPARRASRTRPRRPGRSSAKRHVAGLGRDPELVEQADQPRVRRLVVDDEPGVHRDRPVGRLDGSRSRRARPGRVALEDGHLVPVAVERLGGGQAADAGADDGDPHRGVPWAPAACRRPWPRGRAHPGRRRSRPAARRRRRRTARAGAASR